MSSYGPDAGELIWTGFDPRVGHEQGGRQPALVISPRAFWEATRLAIVCPISSRVRPFASSVVLPPGLPVEGEVLISHVRSIDTLARPVASAGGLVAPAVLAEARGKLAALLGIT